MPPDEPRPDRVSPFYNLVLANLVYPKAVLIVWCSACRREGRLHVVPVLAKRGPQYSVRDLRRSLTCNACGKRGLGNFSVEYL